MATGTLRAIETPYRGYRFRSRSEARFAVFLDALGIRWDYEIEGYELGSAGRYLPDFWLPDLGIWIEIKGTDPTVEEQQKARALAMQSENPVYIFYGGMEPPAKEDGHFFRVGSGFRALGYGAIQHAAWARLPYPNFSFIWVECETCHAVDVIGIGPTLEMTKRICECNTTVRPRSGRLVQAYQASRSARFEHGESGSPR